MRAGLGLIFIVGLYACTAVGPGEDSPGPDDTTTSTDGTGPGDDSTPGNGKSDTAAPTVLATNLEVTNVAVFQAVKVDVVKSGSLVAKSKRNAPLVAKRAGMMRVYVKPGADWEAAEVTAELRLVSGSKTFPVIRDTKTIKAASTDEKLDSTFNLDLPTDSLPAGVTFQVALTMKGGEAVEEGSESSARFPADGSFEDLGVQKSGTLKVVVVPISYQADGTGRVPDVGQKQLKIYEDKLLKWYPTAEVEVTTHDPVSWSTAISRNGSGFSNVLNAMYQLRQKDRVDDDVYYYGVFNPASSMQTFCQAGCVAGLSTVADEDAPMMRASVGLGFNGEQAAETMAHELGHAHGREHAPCGGADGVDPDFPDKAGGIGVWGYDAEARTLISPTKGKDIMGYCPNVWMSAYTYSHLFDRIVSVATSLNLQAAGKGTTSSGAEATEWQMANVGADGALSWETSTTTMTAALRGGSLVRTRFLAENGVEMFSRDARFFRYDHVPGGVLFVPRERTIPHKAIKVDGFAQTLVR